MRVTALFALAATIASTFADIITVQNDINQKISPHLVSLNDAVNKFPASGVNGAQDIHDSFTTLISDFQGTTSDIQATGPFDLVSGTSILGYVQANAPTFFSSITSLGAKKPDFVRLLGNSSQVLADIQALNAATSAFSDALVAAQPVVQKATAIAIKAQIATALATATAVYVS